MVQPQVDTNMIFWHSFSWKTFYSPRKLGTESW